MATNPALKPLQPVAIFLAILFGLILLNGSFVIIGPGQQGVLMTWGAVQKGTLPPGLHLKIPLVQTVMRINVQVQNLNAEESAASLDLQNVFTTVATNWHILADDAGWVYQNVGEEKALADRILRPAISNATKAVTAHYNAEDLIVHRDAVRTAIEQHIIVAVQPFHIIVDSVNQSLRESPRLSHGEESGNLVLT